MSTRRARIKAVISLPPRRKNNESNDNQSKPSQASQVTEKGNQQNQYEPKRPTDHQLTESSEITKSTHNSPPPAAVQKIPNLLSKEIPHALHISPKTIRKTPDAKSTSSSKVTLTPTRTSPPKDIDSPRVNVLNLTPSRIEKGTVCETVENSHKDIANNEAEDFNVPSTPQSITDETAMDGIMPLHQNHGATKPIHILKNEIISENAEVLFDPIVPLPSPSKVRPKLRPVPRLGTLRRNSVQGSASESEDESRRALLNSGATTPLRQRHDSQTSHSTQQSLPNRDISRIRNDSVSSSVSQATGQLQPTSSPNKEKIHNKTRRQDISRRMAAMRRRRETVKRNALTMYDLIFYNPSENPFVPDQEEIKAKEANKKEEEAMKAVEEQEADDPPEAEEAPVPQIKLGPNGEIILDEKSLVIKQTDSKRKLSAVVREGSWSGGGKYTRSARSADWSPDETVRFYRALAALGTDFSLMVNLFPDRSRRDLKLKFKKEERMNGNLVDKAMRSATCWDATRLQEEFEEERAAALERKKAEREEYLKAKRDEARRAAAAKEMGIRRSRGAKALEVCADRNVPTRNKIHDEVETGDELIQRAIRDRKARAKEKQEPRKMKAAEPPRKVAIPVWKPTDTLATITPIAHVADPPLNTNLDITTLTRVSRPPETPSPATSLSSEASMPKNIESGSLVVLTVNDPNAPSKKMLQTYIANGSGQLTPVSLPPNFLNTVVGYMKKGTPKSCSSGSPQLFSPTTSIPENRTTETPGVIQLHPSPNKRQRYSSNSYTITQL